MFKNRISFYFQTRLRLKAAAPAPVPETQAPQGFVMVPASLQQQNHVAAELYQQAYAAARQQVRERREQSRDCRWN